MALFQDFLLRYSEELIPRYGIQALGIDSIDGRVAAYRDPRLVRLDLGKFPNAIARQLDRLGLQLYDGYHVMMHPRLAAVYLAVLADVLARENGMTPITDQPVHCAAAYGWTIDALAEILLTDEHPPGSAATRTTPTRSPCYRCRLCCPVTSTPSRSTVSSKRGAGRFTATVRTVGIE
jgi:hypothetical protein